VETLHISANEAFGKFKGKQVSTICKTFFFAIGGHT
jgi:hypothetical protein